MTNQYRYLEADILNDHNLYITMRILYTRTVPKIASCGKKM